KSRHGWSSLTDVLERQDYEQIRAEASELVLNDKNGAVSVRITVRQGPKSIVHSVREEFSYEGAPGPKETNTVFPNKPYSKVWLQDFTQSLRTNQYHRGYPDTAVEVQTLQRQPEDGVVGLDLLAKIQSGSQVYIGGVEFKGQKK